MKTIFKTFFAAFFLLSTFTFGQNYEKYLGKFLTDVKDQLTKENITNYYDLGYEQNYYISWKDTFENKEVTVICTFPYEESYKCSSVIVNLGSKSINLMSKLIEKGYKKDNTNYKSLDSKSHIIPHFLAFRDINNPFEPIGKSFTVDKGDTIGIYTKEVLDSEKQIFKMMVQQESTTRSRYTEKLRDIFYDDDLPYNFTVKASNGEEFISSMNEFFLSRIRITFENKDYYWSFNIPDEAIKNFKVKTIEKNKDFSVVTVTFPFKINKYRYTVGILRQYVEPEKVDVIYFFVPNERVNEFHTLITAYLASSK